ncbi:MAG TPA: class I SAM-dependent methyltransferase [Anaerolineales bacterium]|nr:class I SAM-dependent methyltransferase [Anaerolineales bacterium]
MELVIQNYWDAHIHDQEIAKHPVGSAEFFRELEDYRFEKLSYLPQLVDFSRYRGKHLVEIGCGVGIDLARFARGGALVTGIDLAPRAIDLARRNFEINRLKANLYLMNGEALEFEDNVFDVVYAHGVLQYTADAKKMISEIHRVLRPDGEAILMVYNKYSWLNLISRLTKVGLEHQDAPVLKVFSAREFKRLLKPFPRVCIRAERFPVRTRLHRGLKAVIYNEIFVRAFSLLPKSLSRPFGWHLMAFAYK